MRLFILAMALTLIGCATPPKEMPVTMAEKTLAPGECGLYVWTADAAKTFTLFASPNEISYMSGGTSVALTEKNPTTPPLTAREFRDETGKVLTLTLLSAQDIEGGTRYKAGRLTSVSEDGWEKVVPVVGLYACQPVA